MLQQQLSKLNSFFEEKDHQNEQNMKFNQSNFLEYELKKSEEYLQKIKRNSIKIETLIEQNDKLKKDNQMQLRTIELHLSKSIYQYCVEKELENKYLVSELHQEIRILNEKLELQKRKHFQQKSYSDSSILKEIQKLAEKLSNCKEENSILRNQNQILIDSRYSRQEQYINFEEQAKKAIKKLNDEIQLLRTHLLIEREKTTSFQIAMAENNALKLQNKNLKLQIQIKFHEYQTQITQLSRDLKNYKTKTQNVEGKYEQLSDIINIVDDLRRTFKNKKKQKEFCKTNSTHDLFAEETQLFETVKIRTEMKSSNKEKQNKNQKNSSKKKNVC